MNSNCKKILAQGSSALMLIALLSASVLPVRAAAGDTTRISVDSSGAQANDSSRFASISGDGRFVAFESDASNLIVGDTNGFGDIFVRDRQTGETSRVSVDSSGAEANNGSEGSAITSDGRFVAFTSDATNLVSGDSNGLTDIFVRDRQTGVTTLVSVSSSGEQANAISDSPLSLSSDGRFVAFRSDATNLVSGDTNGVTDVFVRDTQAGTTERISVATGGAEGNASSFDPSISADGRIVVFSSGATNLVSGDTNGRSDIFVRDRQTGVTTRVSVSSSGVEASMGASDPFLSADGRYISFSSFSFNLVTPEPLSNEGLYVHDRQTGTTILASRYSDGYEMVGWSDQSSISADGRYVAFEFDEKGDGMPFRYIFVRDLFLGLTDQVTSRLEEGTYPSMPSISGDGQVLVFYSGSNRLVSGDTNGANDIFAYEVLFGPDLAPTVGSLQPTCGGSFCTYPTGPIVSFRVTFSEAVTGVTPDDFALNATGGITGSSVADVSGSGNTYVVNVNTGTGDGSLRLDLIDNDSIQDISFNPLGGTGAGNGNFTGEAYTIDKTAPQTTLSLRADPSPISADIIHFNVTFSESVSGVDVSDFALTAIGAISGATVTEVSGTGNTYVVTAGTGSGDGALRLDIVDNDSITDAIGSALGGAGEGNGNFTTGEVYIIDKNAPVVISSLRADSNPTAAVAVRFIVTFSESVRGLDVGDFLLTSSGGITGASVLEISRADNIYTITVATGSGNGTLRLDVIDNDSILDVADHPLGGTGAGNGNFTIGEIYTINKFSPTLITTDFRSTGSSDGWVVESNENSNIGGSKNSSANVFKLGDDALDRQFRSILHFPTYYLPDNAVVTQVILTIKKQDVVGTDPFTTHQNILIDIRKGYFGNFNLFSFASLQSLDFQAPADVYSVGTIQNNPVSGWYWATLDSRAFQYINLTDITQLRLGFQLDDNDDLGEDYLRFYSGDFVEQRDRPHLLIEYYVPR